MKTETRIVEATAADAPVILELIRGLAEYEKLSDQVTATEEKLRTTLFGPHPAAEVLLGYVGEECAGFALFFQTYSTFLGKPGIYLEDLFVKPEFRGRGVGRALLMRVGKIGEGKRLRAVRVGSARLERARDRILQKPRRRADGRMDQIPHHR